MSAKTDDDRKVVAENRKARHNYEIVEVFEAGTIVTPEVLLKRGVIKKLLDGVKILAKGDFTKSLTVRAHKFSAKAQEKISGLGGKAEVLEG